MIHLHNRLPQLMLSVALIGMPATTALTAPTASAVTTTTYTTHYANNNFRSGPSMTAKVVGHLGSNQIVTGTVSGSWLKISSPTTLAGRYISTTILTPTKPATTPPTPPPATTGAYAGGTLTNSYTLYSGYNGVKVYLAQKALGMKPGPMDSTMNKATTTKLASFQKSHRLPANGVLDSKTWTALNTGYPFSIDSWQKESDVMDNAPRDIRVAAMIAFAKAQLGKPYIWGGTGPIGFDCSGLLLQAARAGGMKPKNISNFTDIQPASDLSNQMWKDVEFQKGSLNNLRVGDFIYYGGTNGVAHHIAMYVGNNTIINAVNSSVQYSPLSSNLGWSKKLGTNRAIPL